MDHVPASAESRDAACLQDRRVAAQEGLGLDKLDIGAEAGGRVKIGTWEDYNTTMRPGYEAAGRRQGLLLLAAAWRVRELGDEVVRHALSHGYLSDLTEQLDAEST